MSIVGGLDIHRKQLTFDYVEVETGRLERGRIAPADREHLAGWLRRFDEHAPVAFALEAGTGWRYVSQDRVRALRLPLADGLRGQPPPGRIMPPKEPLVRGTRTGSLGRSSRQGGDLLVSVAGHHQRAREDLTWLRCGA